MTFLDKIEADLSTVFFPADGSGFDERADLQTGEVLSVLFEDPSLLVQDDTSRAVSTQAPSAMIPDSDIVGLDVIGKEITIRSVKYIIRDTLPDGFGVSTLVLEAQ